VTLILWNTYIFFQKFKEEERLKMEILASAYNRMLTNTDLDADISFETQIISNNYNIPMIWTDAEGNILEYQFLDDKKAKDVNYLKKQLNVMKAQNDPLEIKLSDLPIQYIYYNDSDILTNLKYYPLGLVLILFLFSIALYLYNHSNKIAAQNQLWTGMAKETAHQIGTPLTSLLGWITILKEDEKNREIGNEIEKDVIRLEVIANRFSKIGSETVLTELDLVQITKNTFDYLQSRSSNAIEFSFKSDSLVYIVKTNKELMSWVIENLVKNAIDAMQGKGILSISMSEEKSHVLMKVQDSGKGIPKKIKKKIFEPGFTTKKRGWGLGLSLTKRIVEDFHNGKISVLETGEKGTTFLIKLPK
jgi:signal transduction histidine kinase